MIGQKLNAQELMERERLDAKFSKRVPTIEEIDRVINALKILDKLNEELGKLEKNSLYYQKQICEIVQKKQRVEKKNYSYLKVLGLFFGSVMVVFLILYIILGIKFAELARWSGFFLMGLGFFVGVLGIAVANKEQYRKREKQFLINDTLNQIQLKLDSTQDEIDRIKENSQRVSEMANALLKGYEETAQKEAYMERLLELRSDVEIFNKIKNQQS